MPSANGDDLALAAAALRGERHALTRLASLVRSVAPALAARGATADEIDELLQQTQTKLLVAEAGRPAKLTLYSGTGRLGGFVRTAVVRAWLNSRRGVVEPAPAALDVLATSSDPELERLKTSYLEQFRGALGEAWRGLETEHRDHLRHQLVDGLTIDDLATMYGVHRSTAARRLLAAKEALAAATRAGLRAALQIDERELNSIMRLIETRVDHAAGFVADGASQG